MRKRLTATLPLRGILAAIIAAATFAFVLSCHAFGLLTTFELHTVDQRFAFRGAKPPDQRIALVEIDQATLEELGVIPDRIPRHLYGELLDRIHAAQPREIIVDRQFIGATNPADDSALIQAIKRDGPILLATHEGDTGPIPVPANDSNAPGAVIGSAAVDSDPDHTLRRMMYAQVNLETLAVRAAGQLNDHATAESNFPNNHAWIDFLGPPGTVVHYSFANVLNGAVAADELAGRAVLIGVSDPVDDVYLTPTSSAPMSGLEVQANALSTILAGFPLKSASEPIDFGLIVALIAIPAAIGTRRSSLFTLAASAIVLAGFLAAAQVTFNSGWIVAVTYPVVGLAITTAGMVGVDAYVERRHRMALEVTLGDLLPPRTPSAFFISYRRSQNAWQARDIRHELCRRYGDSSVFMDTSSINYGEAFPDRIASAIRGCSVVLVLIGPLWLQPIDGVRRIDDSEDWVRREIEQGLLRAEAVVVPLLVDGAQMPSPNELPEPIKPLGTLHSVSIAGEDLAADIDQLVRSVERGRCRASVAI